MSVILGVVGFSCALNFFPILRPKPLGLPETSGLVCTIALGARWDSDDCQIEMDGLSRLRIGYDELLAVR